MITLDFETRSVADLIRLGQRRYALDASTQVLCLAWSYDQEETVHLWHRGHKEHKAPEPWCKASPRPDELFERIRDGEPVEAHNAGFEFNIWNECFLKDFPDDDKFVKLTLEQLHCSAAKASCLSLPRSLEGAIDALGLPDKKIADGKRLIHKLSKPNSRRPYPRTPRLAPESHTSRMPAAGMSITLSELSECDITTAARSQAALKKRLGRPLLENERGNTQNKLTRAVDEGVLEYDTPPWCEEQIEHERNWAYCQQDVVAERGLSNFCPEMTPSEREYWMMDFHMNLRGIALDIPAALTAFDYAAEETKRLNAKLKTLTGGNVEKGSQRVVLLKWANEKLVEFGAEPLANTKADTLSFALDGVPTKAGDEAREAAFDDSRAKWEGFGQEGEYVEQALRICMEVNRSSVAKYKRMLQSVCNVKELNSLPGLDGRPGLLHGDDCLHDIMLFNGADRTGRRSGKGVQPHNFVRGYGGGYKGLTSDGFDEMGDAWNDILHLDHDLITVMWGEPMIMLAKACRGALIASPGKELYAADFNAIEARKLAWLSGCASMLAKFVPGQDIYCDMASGIYGRLITKLDKIERNLGKKAILGLGYPMGWEKFQTTVYLDEGIWLDDEFCQMVVKIYRKDKYPEVPALWRDK